MNERDESERPRKKGKKKAKVDGTARAKSYGIGAFLLLLGAGMLVGYFYTQRAPGKLFNLLAAGGVASLLSGVGLFLYPLDDERLDAFQNEGNPIAVFGIMPVFWKVWLLLILAAMIGAFVFVAKTTVRVG
jgi:hypothetical protein